MYIYIYICVCVCTYVYRHLNKDTVMMMVMTTYDNDWISTSPRCGPVVLVNPLHRQPVYGFWMPWLLHPVTSINTRQNMYVLMYIQYIYIYIYAYIHGYAYILCTYIYICTCRHDKYVYMYIYIYWIPPAIENVQKWGFDQAPWCSYYWQITEIGS